MKRAAGSETLYPRRSPTKLPTAGCPVSQCRVDSVKQHVMVALGLNLVCLQSDTAVSCLKLKGVSNKTVLRRYLSHSVGMRMGDLTPKQLLSVPCPTCGVAAGARCLLHSGARRTEPHVDRKLSAADAIERTRGRREDGH